MPGLESIVRAVAHLERRSAANNERVVGTETAVVGTTIPSSFSVKEQLMPQQLQSPSPPRLVSTDGVEGNVVLMPPRSSSPKVMYQDGYSRFLPYYEDHHPLVQERRLHQRQQEQQHITNETSRVKPMLLDENRRHHHHPWIGGDGGDIYQNLPLPPRMTQRFVSDHGIVIQVPPPLETMAASHRARSPPSSTSCDDQPAVSGKESALGSGKPSSSPVLMEGCESPPSAFLKKAKKNATLSPGSHEGLISPAISTLLPRIANITTDIDLYFASMEELCKACQKEHGKKLFVPDPNESFDQVESHDVLLGRGGETNHHTGNVQYRMVVKASQPAYLYAKRRDKPRIAGAIVCVVRSLRGRFLKKGETSNLLFDVGNTRAREKTSQALREGAPELRGYTKASTEQATPEQSDAARHPQNAHHHHHRPGPIPHERLPVVSSHHSPSSSPPTHHHHHHHPHHEHQHHGAIYYVIPPPQPGTLRQQHHHDGPPPAYYLEHHPQYHQHHPHHGFSVAAAASLQARMDYAGPAPSLEQSAVSLNGASSRSSHDRKLPVTLRQHGDPAETSRPSSDVATAVSADAGSEEDRRNCAASPSSSSTTASSCPATTAAPSGSKTARGPRIKRLKKRLEETLSE